jgi:ubiquinone biosynthesis protein
VPYYLPLAQRIGNVVRLAEIIHVMVRHGFADLVHRLGLHEGIPARLLRGLRIIETPTVELETRGRRLCAMLTELGPTYVKLGQVLSTRPDLVEKDIAEALGMLQDRVEAQPFDLMRPVIEKALRAPLPELFAEFDETPVASASLSQVYAATLHNGERVAVKVQRPGIRRVIESDLRLIRRAAEWLSDRVIEFGWFDPVGTVDELSRSLRRELDFTVEARIAERFGRNYEGDTHVYVPPVHFELTAPEVLTVGWIDGVRIDAVARYPERESDPKEVAAIGCDTVCRQIFEFRLFHADPHPGNILLTQNNQIAFLDYGMVGHLEAADVVALAELLRAIFQNDPENCVTALLAFTTAGDVYDLDSFRYAMGEFIAFEAQALVGRAQVGRILEELTIVLRRYHLELVPRLSLLLKALATIESTGRALDPDLDMAPIMRPYLEEVLASRLSPVRLAGEVQQRALAMLRLTRDLPRDIQQIVRTLRRGRFKVQLGLDGLTHFSSVVDRASNRLTFGVITGAIIVGSSLLIHAGDGHGTLGLIGYIVAGIFGFSVLVSILRSKNY